MFYGTILHESLVPTGRKKTSLAGRKSWLVGDSAELPGSDIVGGCHEWHGGKVCKVSKKWNFHVSEGRRERQGEIVGIFIWIVFRVLRLM